MLDDLGAPAETKLSSGDATLSISASQPALMARLHRLKITRHRRRLRRRSSGFEFFLLLPLVGLESDQSCVLCVHLFLRSRHILEWLLLIMSVCLSVCVLSSLTAQDDHLFPWRLSNLRSADD